MICLLVWVICFVRLAGLAVWCIYCFSQPLFQVHVRYWKKWRTWASWADSWRMLITLRSMLIMLHILMMLCGKTGLYAGCTGWNHRSDILILTIARCTSRKKLQSRYLLDKFWPKFNLQQCFTCLFQKQFLKKFVFISFLKGIGKNHWHSIH